MARKKTQAYTEEFRREAVKRSEKETELVRSTFCTTLVGLYNRLTPDEKETLDQRSFSYFERAMPVNRKHNFEKEVDRYCTRVNQ